MDAGENCVKTQVEDDHFKPRREDSEETNSHPYYDLELLASKLGENKFLLFKPPSLRSFDITALANKYKYIK